MLRTLSSGRFHPAEQLPVFYHRVEDDAALNLSSVSITSFRLAIFAKVARKNHAVVFDWKSAEILFVR